MRTSDTNRTKLLMPPGRSGFEMGFSGTRVLQSIDIGDLLYDWQEAGKQNISFKHSKYATEHFEKSPETPRK